MRQPLNGFTRVVTLCSVKRSRIELIPDEQCIMEEVVLGMTHEMTKLNSLRVGSHNSPACQQGPMHPGLGFADVVAFATLCATRRGQVHAK